jgi:hypothetical protein
MRASRSNSVGPVFPSAPPSHASTSYSKLPRPTFATDAAFANARHQRPRPALWSRQTYFRLPPLETAVHEVFFLSVGAITPVQCGQCGLGSTDHRRHQLYANSRTRAVAVTKMEQVVKRDDGIRLLLLCRFFQRPTRLKPPSVLRTPCCAVQLALFRAVRAMASRAMQGQHVEKRE